MPIAANEHGEGLDDLLRTTLTDAEGDLLVVDPSASTLATLVSVATDLDADLPRMRLVASEAVLKAATEPFAVASRAADLVDRGALAIRADAGGANTLLVTDGAVNALVRAGDRVATLSTDDEAFVAAAGETYGDRFEAAEEFGLRTPPLSSVRETMGEDLGEAVREDFDAAIASVRDEGAEAPDEVTTSLLVAAKNDVLLYDVSKWGEDVGIGSKATFSRTKTRLEERGLVDTEKVPIEVGRPRLRLKLGEAAPDAGASDPAALLAAVEVD